MNYSEDAYMEDGGGATNKTVPFSCNYSQNYFEE
jgi:hypothetical protein